MMNDGASDQPGVAHDAAPSAPRYVDLNCDAGEAFGPWPMGDDKALIPLVTSVNIACGAHAGDPLVMRRTVELAVRHGVAVGAHPGYPDLQGFGRRALALSPGEVEVWVLAQIGALAAIAHAAGAPLRHVKAHGALYNAASDDPALAGAIARAVRAYDAGLVLVARAASAQATAARELGLRVAEEAFVDRNYDAAGRLLPRGRADALITDAHVAADRAVSLVQAGGLYAADGTWLRLRADTLCIHSDTPGAHALAQELRAVLERAGILLRPIYEPAN
ncbi:MAG TPA: 5-oxoprolinase subunit PxpA [Ktedonobacterales bacterium]|nr:5-oxoprolinase subunit PxpA [Ktedonobacterales bacterium]